jgi:hypothetical protein
MLANLQPIPNPLRHTADLRHEQRRSEPANETGDREWTTYPRSIDAFTASTIGFRNDGRVAIAVATAKIDAS